MALTSKTLATSLGLGAALSMAVTPAAAAEMPVNAPVQAPFEIAGGFDAEEGNADHHRRYRRYRRNRVDAGDVITGILVLGGIAAIADAASSNKRRNRDVRNDRDYRRTSNYPQRRSNAEGSRGLQSAVSQCVSTIERDVRVENVDNVSRTAAGWQVNGTLYNGDGFACRIGQDGRIESVDYGDKFSASPASAAPRQVEDRQWGADRYAAAWDKVEREEASQSQRAATSNYGEPRYTPEQTQQRAAYPGGPLLDETAAAETQQRTRIAQAAE